ncbi:zinc ribbon domain-containing protein [Cronbergia sp. UHCC 0137]|uniref:zinc ribbon domain-containing protein n=1 Tax=Cronbergia sp. UHCC 0137 TaxID=3110239 RepID=UPI002B1EEE63|nr:zinc ribbon domain-containing protein [Cronbergia sp. UHCC 0137]MEA5618639.1 zinc ribbon domain-containing protein [Cronbergia sp. UHCC 0137]
MATVSCSRCHQKIDSQAIICPHCRLTLKAYGHPGIPLHRATGDNYLCPSCIYHVDDSCNFPQRPDAKDCTLYVSLEDQKLELEAERNSSRLSTSWKRLLIRYQFLILILALLLVCFLIALLSY